MKAAAHALALLCALGATTAQAAVRTYVIAIGNNAPPVGSTLGRLQFADDDAAAFYQFTLQFADQAASFRSSMRTRSCAIRAPPPKLIRLPGVNCVVWWPTIARAS